MAESETRHPQAHVGCGDCDAGPKTWTKNRQLPQVGQTYKCERCGHEVFVYDAGGKNEIIKQWRAVTESMVDNLKEFSEEEV